MPIYSGAIVLEFLGYLKVVVTIKLLHRQDKYANQCRRHSFRIFMVPKSDGAVLRDYAAKVNS